MAVFNIGMNVRASAAIVRAVASSGLAATAATRISTAIADLVTSAAALDVLVTAANTANVSNDATAEITAIHTGGTGYDAQYATIDTHLDNAAAHLAGTVLNAGNIADAKADLLSAIAAIVAADTALDTLVGAANTANISNDATTEINAIQTQYAADLLAVDVLLDQAVAQLDSVDVGAQNDAVAVSFDTTAITTTGQLKRALDEAFAQAKRSGQVTEGA